MAPKKGTGWTLEEKPKIRSHRKDVLLSIYNHKPTGGEWGLGKTRITNDWGKMKIGHLTLLLAPLFGFVAYILAAFWFLFKKNLWISLGYAGVSVAFLAMFVSIYLSIVVDKKLDAIIGMLKKKKS